MHFFFHVSSLELTLLIRPTCGCWSASELSFGKESTRCSQLGLELGSEHLWGPLFCLSQSTSWPPRFTSSKMCKCKTGLSHQVKTSNLIQTSSFQKSKFLLSKSAVTNRWSAGHRWSLKSESLATTDLNHSEDQGMDVLEGPFSCLPPVPYHIGYISFTTPVFSEPSHFAMNTFMLQEVQ